MREIGLYNTGDGYQLSIVRDDFKRFDIYTIPDEIKDAVQSLVNFGKAQKTEYEQAAARAAAYLVANATVETQVEMAHLFPAWSAGQDLASGARVQIDGILYEVIQAHTTQSDWPPKSTPALFKRLSPVDEAGEPQPWVQPTGAHDAYSKGDKMIWADGRVYESLIDANTYSPTDYPAGWREV